MKTVMEGSDQPVFIYLDDNHKACNQKLASMLGFNSPREWAEKQGFLEAYVDEKSRETLSNAYWKAMNSMAASTIQLTWMKKGGEKFDSTLILAPMPYKGHMFAVHFVTNIATR